MNVKVTIPGAAKLVKKKGLGKSGDVQRYFTHSINKRMGKYMSHRTGAMSTKLKYVNGTDVIVVLGPYAKYQYYGKVMVNSKTGKGPAFIPGVGYRYRLGTTLKATERDLQYDKTKNPRAGPFWDRVMIASEGKAIETDMQMYINRR